MNRMIDSAILDDEYVLGMDDATYRVWMQLLLNTNKIGISRQPRSISAFRCQKTPADYLEILRKLEADRKIILVDEHVAILNHHKYWDYSTPNGAISAIKELEESPRAIKEDSVGILCIEKIIKKIISDTKNSKRKTEIHAMLMAYGWDKYGIDIASLYNAYTKPIIDSYSDSDSNSDSYSDSSSSSCTIRSNVEKGSGRKEEKKGKREQLAPGVYMSKEEQAQFRNRYGDGLFLSIPEKVSEWARSSDLDIKSGYIMCCQFADREVQNGKNK